MAHFALTKAGGWINGYVVLPSDMDDIDTKTSKAINGDEGGSWAPSAAIILAGSGLQVSTMLAITGTGSLSIGDSSISTCAGVFEIQNLGALQVDSGALILMTSGGQQFWQSGSTSKWENGSLSHFQNGSTLTLDNGCAFNINTTTLVGSTGFVSFVSAPVAALKVNGNTIQIQDGTDPTYLAARTRSIAQPFVLGTLAAGAAGNGYFLNDGAASGTSMLALTKLINGATLSSITLFFEQLGVATGASAINITRVKNSTGVATIIQSTSGPSGGTNGTTGTLTLTISGGLVIDDSQYSYFAQVHAEPSIDILWYPPVANLTNITTLGQI